MALGKHVTMSKYAIILAMRVLYVRKIGIMTSHPYSQAVLKKIAHLETALQTQHGPQPLLQCMTELRVPGISIAVINDYQIEWARGYGVRETGIADPVDVETRFQACSISKPIAAVAALRLVEQGRLDLDADVNTYLTSWKLRSDSTWQPKVTLRQLLSHTAGISVPWVAGYHPAQDIPTLLEVLDSDLPSNTPAIRVTTLPGLRFRYSGGGYCILQKLLTGIMKQSFPQLMHDLVFKPLAMQRSTYEQPQLTKIWENAATGHRSNGQPVAGKWHIFPEMAAAGLWTAASDLARLSLSLQKAKAGEPNQILSTKMVQELLTPQSKGNDYGDIGLGVFIEGTGDTARFGHAGDNLGYKCRWISLVQGGRGCVVMTNSDNGEALIDDIFQTIVQVYEWPGVALSDEPIEIVSPVSDDYEGVYELSPNIFFTIMRANNTLFLQVPNQPPIELVRANDMSYLLEGLDDTLTFVKNEAGKIYAFVHRDGSKERLLMKK